MASKLSKVLARIGVIRTLEPEVADFYQSCYDLVQKAKPKATGSVQSALLKSAEAMRAVGKGSVAEELEAEAAKLGKVTPMSTADLAREISDLGVDLYRVLVQGLTKVTLGSMIWQAEKKLGLHPDADEETDADEQAV